MKLNKWDIIAFLGFFGLVLVFFYEFLTGSQIIAFKDLSRYFYPLRYLMVEQVKAGQFPLWNPYIFCGFPLLASLQICFFYPLTLIHYFLPFNLAFNYYMILHYFLAACFMYALLRYFKLQQIAAFAGGIIWAFSGYLLSISNMNTSLSSVIWLPLTLLTFDLVIKQRTYWRIIALGSLMALQFLGGEPTIIYVTVLFLAAYAAVFSGSLRNFGRSLISLLISGLVSLGLIAVQLLPFLELAKYSDRVVRTTYGLVTFRSFPPRELINFIFPYFFGHPAQFGQFTDALIGKNFQDWLISPYMGILPLILIFFGFGKEKKRARFFLATAVVALILAFGRYTPIYRIIYLVPGIAMIRYPVKYLFLMTFCLTILAAVGFDRLLTILDEAKDKLVRLVKMVFSLGSLTALIFLIAFFLRRWIFSMFAKNYSQDLPGYFFELLASIIEFNLLSLFFVAVYILAFSLILLMVYKNKLTRPIFGLLLVLLISADLLANGFSIAVPVDAKVFSKVPKNYQLISSGKGLYRFFYTPELEKENRLILGEDYNDALSETKDNLSANWHIPSHLYDFYGYESVRLYDMFKYYRYNFKVDKLKGNIKYLSHYNVGYIASNKPIKLPALKLLRHKNKYGLNVYLYRNYDALPRAYILYGNKSPEWAWTPVKMVKYTPNEVIIKASLRQKGRLFLSDTYYPGWKALVDGKEAKISKEKLFRSVKLNPGTHTVKFIYSPGSFKLGGFISLLTIAGLLIGGWINFKKTR